MKNFLYLDSDFLHSFIAQDEDGFAITIQTEKLYSGILEDTSEKVTETSAMGGKVDVGIGFHGEKNKEVKSPFVKTSFTQNFKDIITRKQRDDIYNRFEACKDVKKIDGKTNIDDDYIGTYINGYVPMSFFCFSRIENLFSCENQEIYESNTSNKETFEIFGEILKNINFLKKAIPYDVFLCGDNLFIPLKENFLRGDKMKIGFSFERHVNITGRINKRIQEQYHEKPRIIKTLNEMQNIAFSMLYDFGFVKLKQPYIVTPIAVYL